MVKNNKSLLFLDSNNSSLKETTENLEGKSIEEIIQLIRQKINSGINKIDAGLLNALDNIQGVIIDDDGYETGFLGTQIQVCMLLGEANTKNELIDTMMIDSEDENGEEKRKIAVENIINNMILAGILIEDESGIISYTLKH